MKKETVLTKTLYLAVVTTTLLLAGCQTGGSSGSVKSAPVVSLEEAKKVTANFKTTRYVPAERTIADLRRLIGSERSVPANCHEVRQQRQRDLDEATQDLSSLEVNAYSATKRAHSLNVIINQQFERGRFKDLTDLLEVTIFNAVESSQYYDPNILARASYNTHLARILAATGETELALKRLEAADWELSSTSYQEYYHHTTETRVYAAKRAYRPLIAAYRAQLQSNLTLAEANFRIAYDSRFFLALGAHPLSYSRMRSEIATNLLRQGRVAEAEYEARSAWREEYADYEYSSIKDRFFNASLALPTVQLAEIYLLQGRNKDARYLAEISVNMHEFDCSEPDSVSLAQARHVLAQIQAAEADWEEIASEFETVKEALDYDLEKFNRLYGSSLEWTLALAKTGDPAKAVSELQRLLAKSNQTNGPASRRTAEIKGFLAAARLELGQTENAMQRYIEAVPALLSRDESQGAGVSSRISDLRLNLILNGYRQALLKIRDTEIANRLSIDPVSELFKISNVAHLGRVQRAVSASAARQSISDPDLADLMRREQDAAQEMESTLKVLSTLELAPSDQVDNALITKLRQRFSGLASARRAIAREVSSRFPEYANLIDPGPAKLKDVTAKLSAREVLIMFHTGDTETLVWAVPKTGAARFARLPLTRTDLKKRVKNLRLALDPNASTLGEIPAFDVALAHQTFQDILAPVADGWRGARTLHIVPHGALGQLPFGLLVTENSKLRQARESETLFANYRDVPWLIRDVAIARYPSVNAFVTLRGTAVAQSGQQPLAGFADPLFSPDQLVAKDREPAIQLASRGTARSLKLRRRSAPNTREMASARLAALPRLPDTADEVKGIARALGANSETSIFQGLRANEQTVKSTNLSDRRVIVFATHGLVAGDLDGLAQPALALTAPKIANVDGDGLLTMSEILNLKLNADWVVLSACNTGSGEGAGAEAVSGLGRAFFYAGARSLLVSNWPVETTSAKVLTTGLFEIQAANPAATRADTLQKAMLNLINSGQAKDTKGEAVFSYAHPLFWAPFTLVGDSAGNRPTVN